jgi:hypothetical protein
MVTARQEATDNITLVTPSGLPAKMVRIMEADEPDDFDAKDLDHGGN